MRAYTAGRAGTCVAALVRRSGRLMWEASDYKSARWVAACAATVADAVGRWLGLCRSRGLHGAASAAGAWNRAVRGMLAVEFLHDALGILLCAGQGSVSDDEDVARGVVRGGDKHVARTRPRMRLRVDGVKRPWAAEVAGAYVAAVEAGGASVHLPWDGGGSIDVGPQALVEFMAGAAGTPWAALLGARLGLAGEDSPFRAWYAELLDTMADTYHPAGNGRGRGENEIATLARAMGPDAEWRMVLRVEAPGGYVRLSAAANLVAVLDRSREPKFREVLARHQRASVLNLCLRGKWFMALERCRSAGRVDLSEEVVRSMLNAGEFALAESAREELGVTHLIAPVDPEDLRREAVLRAENYLDLACEAVVVDSGATLARFEAEVDAAAGSDCLCGVDCEWQPDYVPHAKKDKDGPADKAALIQVAFGAKAYLLDVAALSRDLPERFAAAMHRWLSDRGIIKLVFGDIKDMYVIHDSVPWWRGRWPKPVSDSEVGGGRGTKVDVRSVLDVQRLWKTYSTLLAPFLEGFVAAAGPGAGGSQKQTIGLATLCKVVLGKELDKRQQISPWNRRPLSEAQVRYAANDAHSLIRIYEKLTAAHSCALQSGLADQITKDWPALPKGAPPSGRHGRLGAMFLQSRTLYSRHPREDSTPTAT